MLIRPDGDRGAGLTSCGQLVQLLLLPVIKKATLS